MDTGRIISDGSDTAAADAPRQAAFTLERGVHTGSFALQS